MGSFCSWHRPGLGQLKLMSQVIDSLGSELPLKSFQILANSGSFSDNHAFKAVDVFTQ